MSGTTDKDQRATIAVPGHQEAAVLPAANPHTDPQQLVLPRRDGYLVLAICTILMLAVAVVFSQTAYFGFVNFDDDQYVTGNQQIQQGLTWNNVEWAFTHSLVGNWHPLSTISFMFDWQLFGAEARGYHIHNVILHALAAVLLFLVLRRMTGALWPSAMVAAIFAIHPLRAESVAWVTERKDVLCAVYMMLTLGAYVIYATRPFSLPRYSAVVLFFALGLMAKSMLVTVPGVLLLLDYWPLKRFAGSTKEGSETDGHDWGSLFQRLAWLVVEKIPLFLLSIASSVTTVISTGNNIRPIEIMPFELRIDYALVSYVKYLGQIFYPFNLAPHYPYDPKVGPPASQVAAACLVLLAISAAAFLARRRYPYFIVGWLWYLGTLLPVIGVVPGGIQFWADRYTYITQIGLYIALVWWVVDISATWPHRALLGGVAAGVLVAGLMFCCWRQTSYWFNSETLWRHTLASTVDNGMAHQNLGYVLNEAGRKTEAIKHYKEALKFMPDSPTALTSLGNILNEQRKYDEAIPYFLQAIKVKPEFDQAYYNLGVVRLGQGKFEEAMALFEQTVKLQADCGPACNNLANMLAERGKFERAVELYERAVKAEPKNAGYFINFGNTLLRQGKVDEGLDKYKHAQEIELHKAAPWNSIADYFSTQGDLDKAVVNYRKALEAEPDDLRAHVSLGSMLQRQGKLDEAFLEFQRATEINPESDVAIYDLGFVREAQGRMEDAVKYYQKAVDINPEMPAAHSKLGNILYRRGKTHEALAEWQTALQSQSNDIGALTHMAWVLATNPDASIRNGEGAVRLAEWAVRFSGAQDPEALDALAAAYAETGRFPEAVQAANLARKLAANASNTALSDAILERLTLYQDKTPFREAR